MVMTSDQPPARFLRAPGAPDEPAVPLPAPTRPRWTFAPRSLTQRLVIGTTSLVTLLVLATSICTYVALRSFLLNRLDQQVGQAATGNLSPLFRGIEIAGITTPERVWLVAVGNDGGELAQPFQTPEVAGMHVSDADRRALVEHPGKVQNIRTNEGVRLHAVSTLPTYTLNGVPGASVLVGLSTRELDRTMHRLVLLEWIIGAAAILVAFGATTWGVQFSLQRLRGVTTTAQEVAAELSPTGAGLERRVEVVEPDTEVGQLATSMNTLLAAVETQFAARVASEERMRQFLADASHELRTPLTSIRGYAELSRMQGSVETDADHLARIESEGTRMSRLVDDLLTLARTDQGGDRDHEPVDAGEAVVDAVEGVRAAYPGRRIEVTAERDLAVVGDRDQLVRVVRNLATNAVVHTRPDGPIRVSESGENGSVVLRVSDSGPGLAPEQAAHVFERFWRADKARSRAQGGSGLGLSIVAALVQSHGGDVHFDSSVDGGSTVTVRLPRAVH